jgi:hypothetical protein
MRTTTLLLLLAVLATTIHAVKLNSEAGFLRSDSSTITTSSYFSQSLTSGSSYVIKNFGTNNYITVVASTSMYGYEVKPSSNSGTTFVYTANPDGTGYLTTYTFRECVWRNGTNAGLDLCVLNTDFVQYIGCSGYVSNQGENDVCNDVEINIINIGVNWGLDYMYGDFYLETTDDSGINLVESSGAYYPGNYNQKWLFFEVVSS